MARITTLRFKTLTIKTSRPRQFLEALKVLCEEDATIDKECKKAYYFDWEEEQ